MLGIRGRTSRLPFLPECSLSWWRGRMDTPIRCETPVENPRSSMRDEIRLNRVRVIRGLGELQGLL